MLESRYLTQKAVAARFEVDEKTVRKWMAAGMLPFVKFGKWRRLLREDVDAFERRALSRRSA